MPFSPSLLEPQPVAGDAFFGYRVFRYPRELLQFYRRNPNNPSQQNAAINTIGKMKTAYDPKRKEKVIIYDGPEARPVREGLIDVPIEYWNDQMERLYLFI